MRPLSAGAAWAVTEALAGAPAPGGRARLKARDGAARLVHKTGTSHGRRDAWAAGYDYDHTVIVWFGRPDNGSVPGMSGRDTAAPALTSIFDALPVPARGVVGDPPEAERHLQWPTPPRRLTYLHSRDENGDLAIVFPLPGQKVRYDRQAEGVPLKASGGRRPYTWIVNGELVAPTGGAQLQPGLNEIVLVDVEGTSVTGIFDASPASDAETR